MDAAEGGRDAGVSETPVRCFCVLDQDGDPAQIVRLCGESDEGFDLIIGIAGTVAKVQNNRP
jgi:hypothetical protein